MRGVGFSCSDGLIVSVDDELLLLTYGGTGNGFANVFKFDSDIGGVCKEVSVNIEELYNVKYFPRVYYTIFRLQQDNHSGYLLEIYDGTSASSEFHVCDNYKECKKLINEFENL